jgi:hypothetical protein
MPLNASREIGMLRVYWVKCLRESGTMAAKTEPYRLLRSGACRHSEKNKLLRGSCRIGEVQPRTFPGLPPVKTNRIQMPPKSGGQFARSLGTNCLTWCRQQYHTTVRSLGFGLRSLL